jgi:hypothetical protein
MLISSLFAQNDHMSADQKRAEKINKAINNYHQALRSGNNGATESAIINIMSLKHEYPDHDYTILIVELERLEQQGDTKPIRFMSFIVKNYLVYPERYAWIDSVCCEQQKDFYALIAEKVHRQLDRN